MLKRFSAVIYFAFVLRERYLSLGESRLRDVRRLLSLVDRLTKRIPMIAEGRVGFREALPCFFKGPCKPNIPILIIQSPLAG